MSKPTVSIRDLRDHGREVIDRIAAGEHLTVTRSGRPVAELHPLPGSHLKASVLIDRWSRLPHIDPRRLHKDLDAALDRSL